MRFCVPGSGKSTIINSLIDTARKKRAFDCRRSVDSGQMHDEMNYRHDTVQEVSTTRVGIVSASSFALVHRTWYSQGAWTNRKCVHCHRRVRRQPSSEWNVSIRCEKPCECSVCGHILPSSLCFIFVCFQHECELGHEISSHWDDDVSKGESFGQRLCQRSPCVFSWSIQWSEKRIVRSESFSGR